MDHKVQAESGMSDKNGAGIAIFRASAAPSLDESGAMTSNYSPEVLAGLTRVSEAASEPGHLTRTLFRAPGPDGYSLVYAWFKSNYALPPHTHNSDCLYYVVSGEIHMGKDVLRAGDGFFLPANTVYSYRAGPEGVEVLEFRGASSFDIQVRSGTPEGWAKLAAVFAANSPAWKTEMPPLRRVNREGVAADAS